MDALMICLMAAGLASIGGPWWRLVQASADLGGRGRAAMALSALIAAGTSAWLAVAIAQWMRGPGTLLLLGLALMLAGGSMLWSLRRPSLLGGQNSPSTTPGGAIAFTIMALAAQLSESGPFVIFAAAIATREPLFAAIGGGMGMIAAGWLALSLHKDEALAAIVRRARLIGGLALLATGVVTALNARGLI